VPTYQYACTDCAERIEVVQKFTDEPLLVCPLCGGKLRKVFSPVGIVFKGSGFYRTDSRAGATKEKVTTGSAENGSAASGGAKDAGKDGGSAGDKKADKAAAATSSSSSGSGSGSGSSSSPSRASSSTSSSSGSKVA
jgi:putative FmdB family regulatory protein